MIYPPEMTQEEIEQFEYEINRIIDIERNEGQFWAVNAELQMIAHDELERDHDEPYEPDYGDSWYDDQYDLGDYEYA
jgi:hypothetical protein